MKKMHHVNDITEGDDKVSMQSDKSFCIKSSISAFSGVDKSVWNLSSVRSSGFSLSKNSS